MGLFDALDLPNRGEMNTAITAHCPQIPGALRRRGDRF